MDREGFRNRLKQYKEAKGFDPLLKYWDWKLKYDSAPQPDEMPSQPQLDLPTVTSQPLDDRAHRWDNGYVQTNRQSLDSPYEDARYYDYRKPRFEFRKGDVHYGNPNLLKFMGRFGKVLRGGSLLGETILNLFPSEEVELIEDLRVKMDKLNKWLTGLEDIPKYYDGTGSVLTNSEVPWWLRVINFGEKVQPLQQTDINTYRQKQLHNRYKASSFLMAAAQAYGVGDNFGCNTFMKRFDPQNAFLLNEQDQTTIMEQNGYKKIDTTKENDPYGIVRSAARYHNQYKHVPVYELIEHSDTTINRNQLIPLFTQSEPERHYLKDAANHSAVVYGDPNTGKIYRRFYDMNDYGPVNDTKHGFIKGVGDIKTLGARLLDKLGTPFVQRTGFIPYNADDAYRYANDPEKEKIIQDFVRSYHINNGLRPPTWTSSYEE